MQAPVLLQPLIERFGAQRVENVWWDLHRYPMALATHPYESRAVAEFLLREVAEFVADSETLKGA